MAAAPVAAADDDGGGSRELRRAVSAPNIVRHLQAFERHADANGGNRVGGSPGYEASAEYVSAQLRAASYRVTRNEFEFLYNADATPAVLSSPAAPPAGWVDGVDFASMTFSPNGDVTAPVIAVDLVLPPRPAPETTPPAGARRRTSPASPPERSRWSSAAPARSARRRRTRPRPGSTAAPAPIVVSRGRRAHRGRAA